MNYQEKVLEAIDEAQKHFVKLSDYLRNTSAQTTDGWMHEAQMEARAIDLFLQVAKAYDEASKAGQRK